jgi:ribosomal protein L37E
MDHDYHDADDVFDDCPECDGEPVSLGIWAGRYALRCRQCGWTYYNRQRHEASSEAFGEVITREPDPREVRLEKGPVESLLTRLHGDGEWWRALSLVQGPCTDAEALAACDFPQAYYSGPGRGFANAPRIRRNRAGTRVLVITSGGLDV